MDVAILGLGHVGLPLSAAMGSQGHVVHAVEINPIRYDMLCRGESYIVDVDSQSLRQLRDRGLFRPARSLDEVGPVDAYVVATPTPVAADGKPDLGLLDAALTSVARHARPGALVVVESTVYPGAVRDHVVPLLCRESGLEAGVNLYVGYSPDRVDPGSSSAEQSALRTIPKLVAGIDVPSGSAVRRFYESVFDTVVEVATTEVAEFAKLMENTFRYLNIAFVNELSRAAHRLGIDLRDVVSAAATKPFGYMPFHHGPGVGGHCLPNNVYYLNHALAAVGESSDLLHHAARINTSMPQYTVDRLTEALARRGRDITGSTILLLGLAFKANVSDTRNTPAHDIAERLVEAGAKVRAADPWIGTGAVSEVFDMVEPVAAEFAGVDAVVLVTDHDDIDYDELLCSADLVLDTRGRIVGQEVEQL